MNMQDEKMSLDSTVFEAFTHSTDKQYIYLCNVETNLWRWSKAAVKTFDLPGEYVQDLPALWMEKVHPDDRERIGRAFNDLFSGVTPDHSCEYRVKNAEGNYMWVLCKGFLLKNENNTQLCAGMLTDLGQRNKFDPVTGLCSQSQFGIELGSTLLAPKATGGILLWNVDYSQQINDIKGYSFGIELLKSYAQQLRVRFSHLTFYHFTGDQFAVIVPGAEEETLKKLFAEITAIGQNGLMIENTSQKFTISGGAVLYPQHGKQGEDLYRRLEYAFDCAKKQNWEELTFFTDSLHAQSLRIFQLQQRLRQSVQNNYRGFKLNYQPIISASTHKLVGMEALLRWSDPHFPMMSPADFIPILENYGDIHNVGKWVLATALEQTKKWQLIQPELRVSVNVSYLQMQESSFKDFVLAEIARQDFPKHLLVLELTESCNIAAPEKLAQDLNYFRQHGIQIALDDFGTGYASLSVLRDLSADWIKVDQTFVAQIADNDFDKALTQHLILLCTKLGLHVCVEGIETEEIQNVIECFHPDTLQGYFYSRPLDAQTFEEKFLSGKAKSAEQS